MAGTIPSMWLPAPPGDGNFYDKLNSYGPRAIWRFDEPPGSPKALEARDLHQFDLTYNGSALPGTAGKFSRAATMLNAASLTPRLDTDGNSPYPFGDSGHRGEAEACFLCWFKPTDNTQWQTLMQCGFITVQLKPDTGFYLVVNWSGYSSGGLLGMNFNRPFALNTWHMLAVSWAQRNHTVWLDGEIISTFYTGDATNYVAGFGPEMILGSDSANYSPFHGYIDITATWDRSYALNSGAVSHLWDSR